jgi:hypothetical protein
LNVAKETCNDWATERPRNNTVENQKEYKLRTLPPSYTSLGVLIDFLCRKPPYTNFDFGNFTRALRRQIANGDHVCAIKGSRLVGYCGWLGTTDMIAESWLRGEGRLTGVASRASNALAITVVAVEDPELMLPLARQVRTRNPNQRMYFKRTYADPRRRERKASVFNAAGVVRSKETETVR